MASAATTGHQPPARRRGLIAGLLMLPLTLFGVVCGSLLLSILIECIGMHFFWREESWHHAQGMLGYEFEQLSSSFTQSVVIQEPGRTAHRMVQWTYEHLLIKTGVLDWIQEASARSRGQVNDARGLHQLVGRAYVNAEAYLLAACFALLTFLVRVLVLCLTLPLLLTGAFVGLIDGLVRRDIRRFGAGRESGFIYHRAKACIVPLIVLPWVAYLAMPVSVHPLWVLLPGAVLLSVAVNLAVGSFKKYL